MGSLAILIGAALVGAIAAWFLARALFAVEAERSNEDMIDVARRATLAEVRLTELRAEHESLVSDHAALVERYDTVRSDLTIDLTNKAIDADGGVPTLFSPMDSVPDIVPPIVELNSYEENARARVAEIARRTAGEIFVEDNLQHIHGVGPKMDGILREMGFSSFQQIAALTADDVSQLDDALDAFRGRIERDDWVGSAARLYAQKYGGTV